MKRISLFILALLALVSCTKDSFSVDQKISIYSDGVELYIYAGRYEEDYLGKLNANKYDSESIWNKYGTYGSKYNSKSIWNKYLKPCLTCIEKKNYLHCKEIYIAMVNNLRERFYGDVNENNGSSK